MWQIVKAESCHVLNAINLRHRGEKQFCKNYAEAIKSNVEEREKVLVNACA